MGAHRTNPEKDEETAVLTSSSTDTAYSEQVSFPHRYILVVEDSAAVAEMLCCALELAGYRAVACVGGEAWLESVVQLDDPPALVLLDLSIPELDGPAFLQYLRAQWEAAPPIVVLTTSKEIYDDLVEEQVVWKPFRIHDLLTKIAKMW